MSDQSSVDPYEAALGYTYHKALEQGDLVTIETIELLILRDMPKSSYLYAFAMQNTADRMTSDEWQVAIGDVVANILDKD